MSTTCSCPISWTLLAPFTRSHRNPQQLQDGARFSTEPIERVNFASWIEHWQMQVIRAYDQLLVPFQPHPPEDLLLVMHGMITDAMQIILGTADANVNPPASSSAVEEHSDSEQQPISPTTDESLTLLPSNTGVSQIASSLWNNISNPVVQPAIAWDSSKAHQSQVWSQSPA